MTNFQARVAIALVAVSTAGCVLDKDRCDAHQVELSGNFALCVCEPNAVFNANGVGCTPCGENEVPKDDSSCTCKEGFAKTGDAGCTASSVGTACNASTPCPVEFPYCTADEYCSTQGCNSNADCTADYTCEAQGTGRYCKRPPTGLNMACTTDADCAGFEANSCETLSQHICLLKGCATGTVSCPNEWACCDYSAFIPGMSICASPSQLSGGSCPMGGTRVTP